MSVEDTNVNEELETVRAALKKANAEAKQYREERDLLQGTMEQMLASDSVSKYEQRIIRTEAKARLLAEGVKDPERILKYVTAENVKVTDDGLEGLDEVLTSVKKDLPELFDVKRRVGGSADAATTGSTPTKSASEQQIERVLKNMR